MGNIQKKTRTNADYFLYLNVYLSSRMQMRCQSGICPFVGRRFLFIQLESFFLLSFGSSLLFLHSNRYIYDARKIFNWRKHFTAKLPIQMSLKSSSSFSMCGNTYQFWCEFCLPILDFPLVTCVIVISLPP